MTRNVFSQKMSSNYRYQRTVVHMKVGSLKILKILNLYVWMCVFQMGFKYPKKSRFVVQKVCPRKISVCTSLKNPCLQLSMWDINFFSRSRLCSKFHTITPGSSKCLLLIYFAQPLHIFCLLSFSTFSSISGWSKGSYLDRCHTNGYYGGSHNFCDCQGDHRCWRLWSGVGT